MDNKHEIQVIKRRLDRLEGRTSPAQTVVNATHNVLSTAHADSNASDTPASGQVLTWNATTLKWEASPTLTIAETDGSPSGNPSTLKFPAGSLTDNGDGSYTYSASGGHTHAGAGTNAAIISYTSDTTLPVATGTNDFAGGHAASAAGGSSVALGDTATTATSPSNVALGANAKANPATQGSAIAIGGSTRAGSAAQATARNAVAIGADDSASTNGANATADAAIAIGGTDGGFVGPTASGTSSLAMVRGAQALSTDNIAIGRAALADSNANGHVAIGSTAQAKGGSNTSVAIGAGATAGTTTNSGGDVAIGASATATADAGITAVGFSAGSSGGARNATSIGNNAQAGHSNAGAFGVGATTTKANQIMLGRNTEVVTHPGGVEFRVNAKTTTYTATGQDYYIPCDATSAAFTVTLPAATGTGLVLRFKKTDSSANAVTISRAGSDTIDGATTKSLGTQYHVMEIIDRATNAWDIMRGPGAP